MHCIVVSCSLFLWFVFCKYLIYFKNAFTDISVFLGFLFGWFLSLLFHLSIVFGKYSIISKTRLLTSLLSLGFSLYLVGSVYWCLSLRGFQCSILIVVGLL
ncbi:uncharacterized protein B0P05DRAFT_562214 [Gilbertella persicaria]|uniref:uncharacterized protein n=1 Tax=Gilbertella persicaria TaxID=101096 RepID=UPI00221E8B1A|nr:uncharacterized protein B0P05DRAFT_562214 [Gilbertella persicaria]KAI8051879.1 hypothetical protein B0P05DRAFT_562214 [Gilbertella persicaria]